MTSLVRHQKGVFDSQTSRLPINNQELNDLFKDSGALISIISIINSALLMRLFAQQDTCRTPISLRADVVASSRPLSLYGRR